MRAMAKCTTALLMAVAPLFMSCASMPRVASAAAACSIATARVTAELRLPRDHVANCDSSHPTDGLPGYYVLALYGRCREADGCASTLMGWFAVQAATGELFEWDVAEWKLGRPVPTAF